MCYRSLPSWHSFLCFPMVPFFRRGMTPSLLFCSDTRCGRATHPMKRRSPSLASLRGFFVPLPKLVDRTFLLLFTLNSPCARLLTLSCTHPWFLLTSLMVEVPPGAFELPKFEPFRLENPQPTCSLLRSLLGLTLFRLAL